MKAGADPNERPIGRVAGQNTIDGHLDKDASVAEALLKAGAHLEDMDAGRTALFYAAVQATGAW